MVVRRRRTSVKSERAPCEFRIIDRKSDSAADLWRGRDDYNSAKSTVFFTRGGGGGG